MVISLFSITQKKINLSTTLILYHPEIDVKFMWFFFKSSNLWYFLWLVNENIYTIRVASKTQLFLLKQSIYTVPFWDLGRDGIRYVIYINVEMCVCVWVRICVCIWSLFTFTFYEINLTHSRRWSNIKHKPVFHIFLEYTKDSTINFRGWTKREASVSIPI